MSFNKWKSLAGIYPLLRENPISSHLLKREIAGLESLLHPILNSSFKNVADVGSGRGHSLRLLPRRSHLKVAIDNCAKMVNFSKEEYKHVSFLESDACYLPFKSDIFDLLLCIGLLEYIRDVDIFLHQCFCVLKPNGYLLITSSPQNLITYLRFVLGPRIYPRTIDVVENSIINRGFKVISKGSTLSQHQFLLKKE
jgi:ubiquinone/menaquinone biosynthesis C-methylase UbiE